MSMQYIDGVRAAQIEEFPDYYVLEDGRVYYDLACDFVHLYKEKSGYYAHLYKHKKYSKSVRQLVAKYFLKSYKDGVYITNLDGDKYNNHYSNLGLYSKKPKITSDGSRAIGLRFSDEEASLMKHLHSIGVKRKEIMDMFNVSAMTLSDLLNNKTYKHLA